MPLTAPAPHTDSGNGKRPRPARAKTRVPADPSAGGSQSDIPPADDTPRPTAAGTPPAPGGGPRHDASSASRTAPSDETADRAAPDAEPEAVTVTDTESAIAAALDLLRRGCSDLRVLDELRRHSRFGEARARSCLAKAYARLADEHATRSPRERLSLAVEQRNAIIEAAMQNADHRIALSALDQRDKLLGLASLNTDDDAPATLIDLIRKAAGGSPEQM